ncbi:MAG: Rv3235 family protein [Propionibacteriaceae bacterium]|jgi:hypothetical protein|nr:Rv3235 family protein [Propionibacteriaceae bacterium]
MVSGKIRLKIATAADTPRIMNPVVTPALGQPVLPLAQSGAGSARKPRLTPHARRRATGIATAIVEVIAGRRQLRQLEQLMTPTAIHTIRKLRHTPFSADLRIRSLHVQSPEPGVMEVAIHLRQRDVSRAAALRLLETPNGWMCVRFETALIPTIITKAG